MGPSGRQAALRGLQLAAGDAAGADAHARDDARGARVRLTGQAKGVAPGRNRSRSSSSRASTRTPSSPRWTPTPRPGDVANALAARQGRAGCRTRSIPRVGADCVVIGCDSMLYLDGALRGKPASVDEARRQWHAMSGRSGRLYTGHCVIRLQDGEVTHREAESACTTVNFGEPSEDDLTATWTAASRCGWRADSPRRSGRLVHRRNRRRPVQRHRPQPAHDAQVVRPRGAVDRRTLGRRTRVVGSWCAAACRPRSRPRRLRPPRTAGHRRLAVGQPRPARAGRSSSPTRTCCSTTPATFPAR